MKKVAKLIIVDANGKHLLMYRSEHPAFGIDPDLPGGTLEEDEVPLETMIREVYEEVGVTIDQAEVQTAYEGADYSTHGTHYSLFIAKILERPR